MRVETLALLRCPYCGGRVDVKDDLFHRAAAGEIHDAVIGCWCCHFAIVGGIAVMTLEGVADTARQQIEDGQPDAALLTLIGSEDESVAARIADPHATFRDIVDALGPSFEGGYFLYRFSDPTFVTADAVARALASTVFGSAGRAVDLCGGSGHLTRTLAGLSAVPPVLMDLSFTKVWLARRFTAPGCEAVCADAHAPLPFASHAFDLTICNDAFHYIWTKALFAREMLRVTAHDGAAAVTHVHNAEQWNPSMGNALPPAGYRSLFEDVDVRLFGEQSLLAGIVNGRVDLAAAADEEELSADPALTLVASRRREAFASFPIAPSDAVAGVLRINPLYSVSRANGAATLRLEFPSQDYADEYSACRLYLPESIDLDRDVLAALDAGSRTAEIDALRARRIVLDVPSKYF
jgi:SAM-dependent methyltransferase